MIHYLHCRTQLSFIKNEDISNHPQYSTPKRNLQGLSPGKMKIFPLLPFSAKTWYNSRAKKRGPPLFQPAETARRAKSFQKAAQHRPHKKEAAGLLLAPRRSTQLEEMSRWIPRISKKMPFHP
jgi:hypothetical protein